MMKRTARKNDEIVTSMHEKPQESDAPTGRTNINDINKRNIIIYFNGRKQTS